MIDSERYFLTCQRYVELNPVRAALVEKAQDFAWSSHRHCAFGVRNPVVAPHEIFLSLGPDDETRRAAYAALFAEPLPRKDIERIREATNKAGRSGRKHSSRESKRR